MRLNQKYLFINKSYDSLIMKVVELSSFCVHIYIKISFLSIFDTCAMRERRISDGTKIYFYKQTKCSLSVFVLRTCRRSQMKNGINIIFVCF
jgi:hypothetical protein